jgi:hypothetical protein
MVKHNSDTGLDQISDYQKRIRPMVQHAPWVLRITEYKDKPAPVLVIKRRFSPEKFTKKIGQVMDKPVLKDQGLIYGHSLRRCLPVIQIITGGLSDDAGIPLDLHRFIGHNRITFRGNLPLDEEAGAKLALIFKLQERMKDMDRVELLAWRIERFSREEAAYWLSRATQYGQAANRWAQAGMRILLGGQPDDHAVQAMLDKLRK